MDSFFVLYYTESHLKNLIILLFCKKAKFRQYSDNFPKKEVPAGKPLAEKRSFHGHYVRILLGYRK